MGSSYNMLYSHKLRACQHNHALTCTNTRARASSAGALKKKKACLIPPTLLESYLGASLKINTPGCSIGRLKFTLDSSCLSGANFSTLSRESSTWLKKNTRSSILSWVYVCECNVGMFECANSRPLVNARRFLGMGGPGE